MKTLFDETDYRLMSSINRRVINYRFALPPFLAITDILAGALANESTSMTVTHKTKDCCSESEASLHSKCSKFNHGIIKTEP